MKRQHTVGIYIYMTVLLVMVSVTIGMGVYFGKAAMLIPLCLTFHWIYLSFETWKEVSRGQKEN